MQIVITGADGFMGRNLRLRLAEAGRGQVLAVTRDTPPQALRAALEGADFVFHLAGVNRPKDPAEFVAGNTQLTQTVCDLLAATGMSPFRDRPAASVAEARTRWAAECAALP